MKRKLKIIGLTVLIILAITSFDKIKSHKITIPEEKPIVVLTHVEVPRIEDAPLEAIDTTIVGNVQSKASYNGLGGCLLTYKYDWNQEIAYQVCMKESGGREDALNPTDDHMAWAKCMGSYGLMQIACGFAPYFGYSYEALYIADINIDIAYKVYQRAGNSFKPWSACRLVIRCK